MSNISLSLLTHSQQTGRMTNPSGQNISSIIFLGENLLALTEDGKKMIIWSIETEGEGHCIPFSLL